MAPRHLLVAPDKFRGSATALEIGAAVVDGARRAGWTAEAMAMADGGEGLLEALGGERRSTLVTGPLGRPVRAEWRFRGSDLGELPPVAVVEMSRASGIGLVGGRAGNEAEAATSTGTGELVAAAVAAGARRVIVGCGGSACTDGGLGAVQALEGVDLSGVELVVACDVTTRFLDAAAQFAPQKGADGEAVRRLSCRLQALAERYRRQFGLDPSALPGSGAAGGLAGGLAALGGRLVGGFELVAELTGLDRRLATAGLVITGEGRFDLSSLAGKVVGGMISRCVGRLPLLVLAGSVTPSALAALPAGVSLVSLSDRYGQSRSFSEVESLAAEVVEEHLRAVDRLGRAGTETAAGPVSLLHESP